MSAEQPSGAVGTVAEGYFEPIKIAVMDYKTYMGAEVYLGKYTENNCWAMWLQTPAGEPILTASVNQWTTEPGYIKPSAVEVGIKNWAENEGILPALIAAGIISEPQEYAQSGFVYIALCQLLKTTKMDGGQ
jgi:hypothetical protein